MKLPSSPRIHGLKRERAWNPLDRFSLDHKHKHNASEDNSNIDINIDRAQRMTAKIVLKTNDSDAESDLKWLPLSMRRDMHIIFNLTFKCLKGSPPVFFKDYFKVFRTIHNTRGSGHNLLLPKVRTETARKSFYFNGSKLFNSIASEVKDSKSVVIFKTRILELPYFLE